MRKIFVVGLVFFLGHATFSQDAHFSQFYQAPLYLNPGFTGITQQQRLTFNYRAQWPNLPQVFSTYAASYDIWVNELRSGFGVLATTDRMGSSNWQTTTVGLLYSYKVKITEKIVFSPGVYLGYGINGLDRNKVTLGDALQFDGVTLDPTVQSIGNRQYFDFAAGFLMYTRKVWLGASFSHINTPNISVVSITSRIPMKYSIHGGVRIPLSSELLSKGRVSYLTPSFVFHGQGPVNQLNLGINYHIDPLFVGVWYRGKPYEIKEGGVVNQDAVIFQLGAYLSNFNVGYSYDLSLSQLSTTSGGSHEVSIIYSFSAGALLKREKKSNRLIPCPTLRGRPDFWEKG